MNLYPRNYYRQKREVRRLSTGCDSLDQLLFGGIETHAVTEFYGPSGVGKTQLCYTLSVIAAGTEENCKVLYMDTEHKFRPERILSISQARGFCDDILSKILHFNIINSSHQELILRELTKPTMLLDRKRDKISLIIVDSVVTQYRREFGTPNILCKRQQKMHEFMFMISAIAQTQGIAVVITNQVNSGNSYTIKPTGGSIIAHNSSYRIMLRRAQVNCSSYRVANVVKSSYHRQGEAHFKLGEKGVEDIEDSDSYILNI
jgi:RecA/RadA recombinase